MTLPESAKGAAVAFDWKTYAVSKSEKAPLLAFIVRALEMRGCRVLHQSPANRAPFYIVFETPLGERQGILAYPFFANSRLTQNRPTDEHRFQIKYGSELRGVLDVRVDPQELITTIFLGIDPKRGIFVAADPLMNSPSPMSRSVEFKAENVEVIIRDGWTAWERARNSPKTKSRPTSAFNEDDRVQVLVGGRQERLLDLIQLERLGRGLDAGERHLLADKLKALPGLRSGATGSHRLLTELDIPSEALFDLIDGANRLKMAVRGWVAEAHLERELRNLAGVTNCSRIEGEGQPDISLQWKGGQPIVIECKNVLRRTNANGCARVDFQRTRASKGDPCSRYYRETDFPILAASLHAVLDRWQFSFALTKDLPPHSKCSGRISSNIVVDAPAFTDNAGLVFDKCSGIDV